MSKTKLLSHVPPGCMSACVRHVPVPFLPGTSLREAPRKYVELFSQYSAVFDTLIPRERSDADSESTPNPANTSPLAQAYSFNYRGRVFRR